MSAEEIACCEDTFAWHKSILRATESEAETGTNVEQVSAPKSTRIVESDPENARDGEW